MSEFCVDTVNDHGVRRPCGETVFGFNHQWSQHQHAVCREDRKNCWYHVFQKDIVFTPQGDACNRRTSLWGDRCGRRLSSMHHDFEAHAICRQTAADKKRCEYHPFQLTLDRFTRAKYTERNDIKVTPGSVTAAGDISAEASLGNMYDEGRRVGVKEGKAAGHAEGRLAGEQWGLEQGRRNAERALIDDLRAFLQNRNNPVYEEDNDE